MQKQCKYCKSIGKWKRWSIERYHTAKDFIDSVESCALGVLQGMQRNLLLC